MSCAHAHALHNHGHSPLHRAVTQVKLAGIIDRFLVGFFDRTLLGSGAAAIEQNPFDEVTLEVIGS